MPAVGSKTWQVRPYCGADRPSVLRLSALHYQGKEGGRAEYLDWLASDAPAGRPLAIVGEDVRTGDVVGFLWNVPFWLKVGPELHRAYMSCNGLVHPDFRRSAVYSAILEAAVRASDAVTIYGFPKEIALFRLQSAGSKAVTRIPLLVRPLVIDRLTRQRLAHPLLRLGVELGWGIASRTLLRSSDANLARWDVHLAEVADFDESFDAFWAKVAAKYEVSVIRDQAFLRWRFRGAAFRSYPILVARTGTEIVGYAVLRCAEIEGISCGMIADLLVESGARGDAAGRALVAEATRRLKAEGMALAGSLMLPHTQEYRVLRQTGYVPAPDRVAPQKFRIMATPFREGAYRDTLPSGDRWFVTMADHDAI
jgi:GNAT superfamily N-acetyltransferase